MNLNGEPAFIGRHCGGHEYELSREVVDFYADALDDHSPWYEQFAPPLLHHSECYKFVGEWYLKNLFGNLHARQDWEFFEPMRVGAKVRTRSTIIERYHKRGRDYVVNETELQDAQSAQLLMRGRTHQSFLPSGAKLAQKPRARVRASAPREDLARADATAETFAPLVKTIDARRCWMFSGPGRNYHTDKESAARLGFPNIVVQGMMSTCFVAELMLREFGEGFLRGGRMSLKLTDVVWVDETLRAQARVREREKLGSGTGEGAKQRVHCEVWVDKVRAQGGDGGDGDGGGARVLVGEASALA